MGDWCSVNVTLVISSEKDSDSYTSFDFRGKVYELSSCSYLSFRKGDSLSLNDDGKVIHMCFSFYDGGCDISEAVADQVKQLGVIYESHKNHLADYIVDLHKETGIYAFSETSKSNDVSLPSPTAQPASLLKAHDDYIDSERAKLLNETDTELRSKGFLRLMQRSLSLLKQTSKN